MKKIIIKHVFVNLFFGWGNKNAVTNNGSSGNSADLVLPTSSCPTSFLPSHLLSSSPLRKYLKDS